MYTADNVLSFAAQSRISQRALLYSLALVTALPLIGMGFGFELFNQNEADITLHLLPVIAVAGIGHVGATAFFYFDRDFFSLIGENKQRFLLWPVITAIGCLAVFSASAAAWTLVLTGFLAWQL